MLSVDNYMFKMLKAMTVGAKNFKIRNIIVIPISIFIW